MSLHYLSADQLLSDSQQLAINILKSGFVPDLLVALWRGGTPVGIGIHEVLALTGHRCEHLPIRAESYTGINEQREVRFSGLELLHSFIITHTSSRILLVDDVFDTGRTIQALVRKINDLVGHQSLDIRIATPWFKPGKNRTSMLPDFYLHTTEEWLVFPHELQDLSNEEMLAKPGNPEVMTQLVEVRRLAMPPSQAPGQA